MIKGKTVNGDLVIGLTRKNLQGIKAGKPIVFNLRDIEYDLDANFIITCTTEGNKKQVIMPNNVENKFGIILLYENVDELLDGELTVDCLIFKIILFARENNVELRKCIQSGITERTKYVRTRNLFSDN